MDYLTTQEPEEMSLSSSKKCQKRQGAELLCNFGAANRANAAVRRKDDNRRERRLQRSVEVGETFNIRVTGRPQILTLRIEGFRHPLYSLVSCIEITTRESPKSVQFAFKKRPIYLRTSSYSAMTTTTIAAQNDMISCSPGISSSIFFLLRL